MNKEIEIIEKYLNGLIGYPFQHRDKEYILSYIEQLQTNVKYCKQKLVQYENPDDLTLFYMWLDTKAKDKMKQMEAEITNLKQQNSMITKLGEQLQNNRDKAIEVINTQLKNAEGGLKDNLRIIKFNLIKGSCTFEDLKTEEDYKYILKGDGDE